MSAPGTPLDDLVDDVEAVTKRLLVLALVLAGALLVLAGVVIGQHLAPVDRAEHERTRRAVCLLLDEVGADAATPEQAEPCRDTPAGS